MSQRRANSLERKLTQRMILVQMLSLTVFFGFGVFPLVIYPALNQLGAAQTLDPGTGRMIAETFVGIKGDRITIEYTPDVRHLLEQHPDMFVYAETADGASATIGTLPHSASMVIPNLALIDTLDVRPRQGEEDPFLVRNEQSPIGPVHVLIGNGPMVGIASLLRNVAIALAVAIWLVLTIASLLAIPFLVRRELRGVQHVADDARRIDFETRGGRLREDGVPSEILSLVVAVNAALSRLDQSYAGRQRFLAAAAHEVRTPIAILQMRLEQSPPFPERQQLLLDVARLGSLAEQLLELQRIEQAPPDLVPVNLQELVEQVVSDLAPLAIASGYEISMHGAHQAPLIMGDAQGLYRAVANLVQNAIAYAGGRGEIVVGVNNDGSVSVSDAGQGIPQEERERIFEPFHRLSRAGGGTGLGLNLVQAIMALHGGSVSVGSSSRGGAQFTLHFQRADSKMADSPPSEKAQG